MVRNLLHHPGADSPVRFIRSPFFWEKGADTSSCFQKKISASYPEMTAIPMKLLKELTLGNIQPMVWYNILKIMQVRRRFDK